MDNAFALARVILDGAGKHGISDEQIAKLRRAYDPRHKAVTQCDQYRQAIFAVSVLLALLAPTTNQGNDQMMSTETNLPKRLLDAIAALPGGARVVETVQAQIDLYSQRINQYVESGIAQPRATAFVFGDIVAHMEPQLPEKQESAILREIEAHTATGLFLDSQGELHCKEGQGKLHTLAQRLASQTDTSADRWLELFSDFARGGAQPDQFETYALAANNLADLQGVSIKEAARTLCTAWQNPLPILVAVLARLPAGPVKRQKAKRAQT